MHSARNPYMNTNIAGILPGQTLYLYAGYLKKTGIT
jgi:hypothetical protein